MKTLPDGRATYTPRNSPDPYIDACLLADAIASADAVMFNADGKPMWLKGETLVLIGRDTLQQFVAEYVVTPKAVFTDSGELAVRFEPYAINEVEIRLLLGGKSPQEGGLKFRLPLSQMPPSPVVQPEPPVRAGAEDAAARVSHSALAAR